MAVQTPSNQVLAPIHIRILVQKEWGAGEWEELSYWQPDRGGFELHNCDRVSLPNIGTATFSYKFGRHITKGGLRITGTGADVPSGQWNASSDQTDIRDVTGWAVQIKAARGLTRPENGSSDWQTIWLGGCEYHIDSGWPAADVPHGVRTYHCVDLWAFYARRWINTQYSFISQEDGGSVTTYDRVRGAPRYNMSRDGREIGNRWSGAETYTHNDQTVHYITNAGHESSTGWTDFLVVKHQIANSRGPLDPWFDLTGATGLLDTSGTAWRVREGESVFDVVNRVLDRRRGRGCVFAEWTASGETFDLDLKVYSQFKDDITYTDPDTGGSETLPGAENDGTTVTIDLIGDHRVVSGSFQLGTRHQTAIGYLETIGERIEIAFTAAYEDSTLVEGWDTDSWEDDFNAASADERKAIKYLDTYHLHRLPRDWDLLAGDGNGNVNGGINFRCQDDGAITIDSGLADIAPEDIELLPDLPAYVPYDISTDSPTRYDALNESGATRRINWPDVAALRTGDDEYERIKQTTGVSNSTFRHVYDGVLIYTRTDETGGTRAISESGTAGFAKDYTDLVLTLNARIPNRIRVASGDDSSYRRKTIYVPGLHLWLWHHLAIYSIDDSDGSPNRQAYGGTSNTEPGIARDDRGRLMFIHQLAWTWYQDSRRNMKYTVRDCALLTSFQGFTSSQADAIDTTRASTETINYPKPGQLVKTLTANGEEHEPNCPITRMAYDHDTMSTTISADWVELDFQGFL